METALQTETKFLIRIGDQIVNADNIVSFDLEGSDIVQIWYVGSATPLIIKPPVPSQALFEVLQSRQWLL
jgi:hypothetical protein